MFNIPDKFDPLAFVLKHVNSSCHCKHNIVSNWIKQKHQLTIILCYHDSYLLMNFCTWKVYWNFVAQFYRNISTAHCACCLWVFSLRFAMCHFSVSFMVVICVLSQHKVFKHPTTVALICMLLKQFWINEIWLQCYSRSKPI